MSKHNDRSDVLILRGEEIVSLLTGQERGIIEMTRAAYEAHAKNASSLPHSVFLTFPDHARNRIIALPAYLGDGFEIAGLKWIASFPDNHESGMDRASAVMILNSAQTGRPEAILEASIISSKRTAASAALAAKHLVTDSELKGVGMVGCGLINFETARFLLAIFPALKTITIYDRSPSNAATFAEKCRTLDAEIEVVIKDGVDEVLASSTLISFATTATEPFVESLAACPPGSTILHISLRDLVPEVILQCVNVVDDVDHVCRARTSVHLAEQIAGNRDFIKCTLADVTSGRVRPPQSRETVTVFSPFGLGVLDLALGKFVSELAREQNIGRIVEDFLPPVWTSRV